MMKRFRPPSLVLVRLMGSAALATTLASTLPAAAQIALTPLSLTARAYDSIESWQERDWRPAGLVEIIDVPGHVLVDVRLVADGPWSDEVDSVRASSNDIRLVLPDGTELEPQGGFQYWGQYSTSTPSFSGRRPRDYPDEDQDIYWNSTFIVPEAVSSATLRIGGDDVSFTGNVTIPKTDTPEDAASFADFRVNTVRRYRVAELEDGYGDDAVPSTITATPGMVMAELEIEVSATASNRADGDDRFNWSTHNFRLVDADRHTLPLVGEQFSNRFLDWQFNGVNIGDSAERSVIFLVPEDLTEATLLFGETEVASVSMGGAPINETN